MLIGHACFQHGGRLTSPINLRKLNMLPEWVQEIGFLRLAPTGNELFLQALDTSLV